jgi:hypothetical protein
MKKRNLLITAVFVCLVGFLPACELLEECGTCELVTDDNGTITRSTPLPFCGEALKEKQNSTPQTIGNVTTYWECY